VCVCVCVKCVCAWTCTHSLLWCSLLRKYYTRLLHATRHNADDTCNAVEASFKVF